MQYYCQLHSLQYTQVCLQSDCKRKGPLCDMCIDSHDQHLIQNLDAYINDYNKYLGKDYQSQILIKLEQMKTFFHNKISQLLIDINSVDEKRKKDLIRQMKTEKMSIQQFQSKVIELIHRDQLKDREYLESFLEQIQEIEIQMKQLFSQLPIKLVQQQNHSQPQSQSLSIINKSIISSDQNEISPQLSNRSKSKEPIFQQKPQSISPIRKQLLLQQRDLMPVGSFNNSKLKNYFTEQDPQQSARSKQDTQTSFKITRPFEIERDSSKNKNGDVNSSKQKSQNTSFEIKQVEPFRINQTQSIDILPKSPQELKRFDKSPKNGNNNTPTSQFKFIQQEQQNQSLNKGYFTNQQKPSNSLEQLQRENQLPYKSQFEKLEQQQIDEKPLYFTPNQGQTEQVFQHSNNDLFENQPSIIFQQNQQDSNSLSIPNRQSSQQNLQSFQNTKSELDVSYISQKSNIVQPQVKLTQNLLNPFTIEHDSTLKAHEKSIKDMLFLDENRLITCSKDKLIKIWDRIEKKTLISLEGHTDQVICIAFSPKRMIASGSVDKTIRLWKPAPQWKIFQVLQGHQERIRCVEFIKDYVASGSDDTTVKLWNFDGQTEFTLKTNGRVSSLQSDKSNLVIATGKSIILFDINSKTKQNEVIAHNNLVQCLKLESNKNQSEGILFSGSKDNTIKLWNYPKLIELRKLVEDYPIQTICFSLKNHLIVGMMGYEQEGKISIWRIEEVPLKVQEIAHNQYGCNKLLYDGKFLYSAHENRRIEYFTITTQNDF